MVDEEKQNPIFKIFGKQNLNYQNKENDVDENGYMYNNMNKFNGLNSNQMNSFNFLNQMMMNQYILNNMNQIFNNGLNSNNSNLINIQKIDDNQIS